MFRELLERFERYRKYRQTYNALQRLSDYELKDIGMSRGMIKRVALERADVNDNLKGWV